MITYREFAAYMAACRKNGEKPTPKGLKQYSKIIEIKSIKELRS